MASDESMKTLKSCMEFDEDDDDGDHPHLSRLSMCSSNSIYGGNQLSDDHEEEEDGRGGGMNIYMSLLSIESFDGDLDEEEEEAANKKRLNSKLLLAAAGLSTGEDDSDRECYSLPATPPRLRRSKRNPNPLVEKEYASENEAHKVISSTDDSRRSRRRNRRRRRMRLRNRSSWLSPSPFHQEDNKCSLDHDDDDQRDNKENMNLCDGHCHSFSGESEGTGKVIVTRPKGGNRSLCMDMEEVKACRDLGFELEHENRMQPSRLSLSASTLDASYATSSGSNSPITNWRISSPGDHPQEVKARLKVWAQAVALASTSRQGT